MMISQKERFNKDLLTFNSNGLMPRKMIKDFQYPFSFNLYLAIDLLIVVLFISLTRSNFPIKVLRSIQLLKNVLRFLMSSYDKKDLLTFWLTSQKLQWSDMNIQHPGSCISPSWRLTLSRSTHSSAHLILRSPRKWFWANIQRSAIYGNIQKAVIEHLFTNLEIPTLALMNC